VLNYNIKKKYRHYLELLICSTVPTVDSNHFNAASDEIDNIFCYISPICPEALSRWICIKFGIQGPLAD